MTQKRAYPLKPLSLSFCYGVFFYLLLYGLLGFFPKNYERHGALGDLSFLAHDVRQKATNLAADMTEQHLALQFLGNMSSLSTQESALFQSSGLVHLLAISGGQILPVISLWNMLLCLCLFPFLSTLYSPHRLMQKLSLFRQGSNFFIALVLGVLFGCTGAILRVSWLSYLPKLRLFRGIQSYLFSRSTVFCGVFCEKIIIVLLFSLLFGNVFCNYSFILSAVGASCAEISGIFCHRLLFQEQFFPHSPLWRWVRSSLFQNLAQSVVTCLFVGILLWPLTYSSLSYSCMANILAIPFVTWVITPLTLLLLILPKHAGSFFSWVSSLFDQSLWVLKELARIFSDSSIWIPFKNSLLFSEEGLLYLNTTMVVLWSICDMCRSRRISQLRFEIRGGSLS